MPGGLWDPRILVVTGKGGKERTLPVPERSNQGDSLLRLSERSGGRWSTLTRRLATAISWALIGRAACSISA